MRIYTRTGDKGITSFYGGKRVRKDDPRITAYGTLDELNSVLGILISHLGKEREVAVFLVKIQSDLLYIGSYLAGGKIDLAGTGKRVTEMEKLIDELESLLPPLKNFILPSGSKLAAFSHLARAVCRRAERKIVNLLDEKQGVDGRVLCYLNRLSDLMFVIARYLNKQKGKKDLVWKNKGF